MAPLDEEMVHCSFVEFVVAWAPGEKFVKNLGRGAGEGRFLSVVVARMSA